MANANLCMFVYARTHESGFRNERYVIHTYVSNLHTRAKLKMTERQRDRERDIETDRR